MLVMPANDVSKWRVLSRLYPYLKGNRGRLAAGLVAIILSNAFQMMGPWIMGRAVDSLYEDGVPGADGPQTAQVR